MERLDEEFEKVLENSSSAIDLMIDDKEEEESKTDLEASLIFDDPIDAMMEAEENSEKVDKDVKNAIDTDYATAMLITDKDIDDIANGKKLVDDPAEDEDPKVDKEVKEYTKDVLESGLVSDSEADRLLSGESFEEVMYSESDEINSDSDELFPEDPDDSVDFTDCDDGNCPDIVNVDPERDISTPGDKQVYHDGDDEPDDDSEEDDDMVKFEPYDDDPDDDEDDDEEDDDDEDDDFEDESANKEETNMDFDDDLMFDFDDDYSANESVVDDDSDYDDFYTEADEILSSVPGFDYDDYTKDDGAGINSKDRNTGFLKGMPDEDERKYGHVKADKSILGSLSNMFKIDKDPNIDEMKLR